MKKIYKKIITINYNDKLFTIFLADDNRRTFLETNKEGKYFYPLLDDFMALNEIYNNINPFISYITKCTFIEKVRNAALAYTVGSFIGLGIVFAVLGANHYSISFDGDKITITKDLLSSKEMIQINDFQDLDDILGYKYVSIDEVHNAIDNNETIPYLYKLKTHLFLNIFMMKHPNWDLRIFYENIKTMDFSILNTADFKKLTSESIGGRYNGKLNQLLLPENASDTTFYHELSHAFDIYYREYEDKVIVRGPNSMMGVTFNEAMTNELICCITNENSYDKYGTILNYFRKYVKFDYYDFNEKGINYYVDLLKNEYPDVDINFIVCALDTINETEKNTGSYIYLDQVDGLIDEIFKVCLEELKDEKKDYYAPFCEFARIFYYTTDFKNNKDDNLNNIKYPDIMYTYLEKYNDLLRDMQYGGELITKEKILEKVSKYEDIKNIFYQNGSAIPVIREFSKEEENGYLDFYIQTFDKDGNKQVMLQEDYLHPKVYIENLYYFMQITGVEYYDILGTSEYWEKIGIDSESMKVKDIESVPIYLDGELLGNEFIDDLTISIGQARDGSIAYEIKRKDGYILYSYDALANNTSNSVPLKNFLKGYNPKDFSSLELKNILNDYYLLSLLSNDCFFYNVIIQDNTLKFMPNYQIEVNEDVGTFNFELGSCYLSIYNEEVKIYPLDYVSGFEGKVYLKDILTYYNVLNEDTLLYKFTKDELMDYYKQYMEDINNKKENTIAYK